VTRVPAGTPIDLAGFQHGLVQLFFVCLSFNDGLRTARVLSDDEEIRISVPLPRLAAPPEDVRKFGERFVLILTDDTSFGRPESGVTLDVQQVHYDIFRALF